MSDRTTDDAARPPGSFPAAALPIVPRDGAFATGEFPAGGAPSLVGDSVGRTMRRIALPSVASSLLMTLFVTTDSHWVGTRIGHEALAAVSTAVFWVWAAVSVAELVSVGLTAVASRRHGEGRPAEAARVAGDALLLALGLGVLVGWGGAPFVDRVFAFMQTPPAVTALGVEYLRTYLLGAPLIFGFFAVDATFRASGDTRTPFALLAASVAATLLLDPALILGWGPFPALGVAGAAIATVATRGMVAVLGLVVLLRRGLIRFGRPRVAPLLSVARVGMPTAVAGVAFSVIYGQLTTTTARFGTPALAALGIGHRVESWLYMVGVGCGVSAAAVVGQSIGAGRPDRAARAGWIATAYASAPALFFALMGLAAPAALARLFTDDPATVAAAAGYLRIAAFAQLFVCAEVVLEGALGGAGHSLPPMITSTALTAARLPLAPWAAARWGIEGVWWTITLTAAARGLAMVALWRGGGWRGKSL